LGNAVAKRLGAPDTRSFYFMEQAYWFLGLHIKVLANGQTTGGRYDLLECLGWPGSTIPWLRHTTYDMQLFVLEGELTVRTKAHTVVLTAGQSYLIMRGIVHTINSSGPEAAHSLVVASPSSLAQVVRAVGTYVEAGSLPPTLALNPLVLSQALAEIGDELLLTSSAEVAGEPALSPYAGHWEDFTLTYLQEVMRDFID
jgi:quercetin dioxygenase-like cupin family protein